MCISLSAQRRLTMRLFGIFSILGSPTVNDLVGLVIWWCCLTSELFKRLSRSEPRVMCRGRPASAWQWWAWLRNGHNLKKSASSSSSSFVDDTRRKAVSLSGWAVVGCNLWNRFNIQRARPRRRINKPLTICATAREDCVKTMIISLFRSSVIDMIASSPRYRLPRATRLAGNTGRTILKVQPCHLINDLCVAWIMIRGKATERLRRLVFTNGETRKKRCKFGEDNEPVHWSLVLSSVYSPVHIILHGFQILGWGVAQVWPK